MLIHRLLYTRSHVARDLQLLGSKACQHLICHMAATVQTAVPESAHSSPKLHNCFRSLLLCSTCNKASGCCDVCCKRHSNMCAHQIQTPLRALLTRLMHLLDAACHRRSGGAPARISKHHRDKHPMPNCRCSFATKTGCTWRPTMEVGAPGDAVAAVILLCWT